MRFFVFLGLIAHRLLRAAFREKLLNMTVLALGYRVLAWESEPHRRHAPPHDTITVVKIALRE